MIRTLLSLTFIAIATMGTAWACPECAEPVVVAQPAPALAQPAPAPEKRTPKIQLAVLLDTSGSMNGLIDQARSQIWRVVNTFARAKQDGVAPTLEVALFEYGNNGAPAEEGHVRQVVPLSTDLDKVSEKLFALTTNGGSEYCGTVIRKAVQGLQWSDHKDDYRAIFIAGNEPFTQGSVAYTEACKESIGKGIIVNTIHCGSEAAGIEGKWRDGALLADGSFTCIDHNAAIVHIASPYDEEIVKLGQDLNKTYIPWGKDGQEAAKRQEVQDKNAAGAGQGAEVERANAKGGRHYRNDGWDLVDALENKTVKIEDVKPEDLPEELRKLSKEELQKYVDKKKEERAEMRKKLEELNKKRDAHVAEERKKQAEKGEKTLDEAMVDTVKEQAARKNIKTE